MPRFGVFLGAVLGTALGVSGAYAACDPGVIDVRNENASARFTIEIADDPAEQAQGLMFVEELPQFSGMLFINEAPRRTAFWMKNTLIPLDMLFIDATGRVQTLHENATPLSEETIDGGEDILAVLEINGGLSKKLGIREGAEVRHPSFDAATAAWPCE